MLIYDKLRNFYMQLTGANSQLSPKDPTWLQWIISYKSGMILKD